MLLAKDSCLAKEKKRKRLPTTPSGVLYYFRNYVRLSYLKTELKTSAFLQWLGSQPKNKQTNKPHLVSYNLVTRAVTRIYCGLDYMVYEAVLKSRTSQQPGCIVSQD